jgi:hypothetical protein
MMLNLLKSISLQTAVLLFAACGKSTKVATSSVAEIHLQSGLLPSEASQPNFKFPMPFFAEDLAKVQVARGYDDYLRYFYANTFGGEMYHDGLDLRVPAGTRVRAIKPGRVTLREAQPFHSSISIDETDANGNSVGRRWSYTHIEFKTLPQNILDAAKTGNIVEAGEEIAQVVRWIEGYPGIEDQISPFDEKRYDHLHFQLNTGTATVNLSRYLDYADDIKPEIRTVYFVKDNSKTVLSSTNNRQAVSGKVDIAIDVIDFANNSPFPMNTINAAEINVRNSLGNVVYTRKFNELTNRTTIKDLFLNTLEEGSTKIEAQGDQFARRSFFVMTHLSESGFDGSSDAKGGWDTGSVVRGIYKVEVVVKDEKLNVGRVEVEVLVD